MTEEEKEELTTKKIVDAMKESQESWMQKLFWNPAAVGFVTMTILLFVWFLTVVLQSDNAEYMLEFLNNLIP